MGRNKKDATQDVLNLYNQMQEDENIESGKEEIKVTQKERAGNHNRCGLSLLHNR